MKRLLLISNSTQHGSGYLDHCEAEIRDFLGEASRIVFVPFALHDLASYAGMARRRFRALGIEVSSLHESPDPQGALRETEGIFIGGGNTFRLLEALYRLDLLGAIRRQVESGTPYVGASAGSNVACLTIKTTNDMPIVQPPSFDALGLVPFNINPHYLDPDPASTHQGETREERIRQFHEVNEPPVVGLREGAMLRVEAARITLKGARGARIFLKNQEPREASPGDSLDFLASGAPI
jgi:dipeptidase E